MTLARFFEDQFRRIDAFLVDPKRCVLRVLVDAELRPMPLKYLARRDEDPKFPHLLIGSEEPFVTPHKWFAHLLHLTETELAVHAPTLAAEGIDAAAIAETAPGAKVWDRFLLRAEALAQALPDHIGSLTFVIATKQVYEPQGFARAVRFLADGIVSPWFKLLIIEDRIDAPLEPVVAHPKVATQVFYRSPPEIEADANALLGKGAAVPPVERRQALAVAALMAYGRKDYGRAETMQKELVAEARREKNPAETATALYNLGNTQLAAKRPEDAVETLTLAADGCNFHKLEALAPMVYTNLGVALYRAGARDEAYQSLRVARDGFRKIGSLPGEAHACDTLAILYQEDGRNEEAGKAWRYALGLYDSIANPTLADVRKNGRVDIAEKMKRFGHAA